MQKRLWAELRFGFTAADTHRALERHPPSARFSCSMIQLGRRTIDLQMLRPFVEKRLCEIGQLEPHQFPVTEQAVVKGGEKVGIYFCLHGPRSVKITAICDLIQNSIIYYGSDGIRHKECDIAKAA